MNSILNQTYPELELLMIDDRPEKDPSLNKLGDSRINWIKNQGKGLIHALNTGLAEAKGHFIARIDADDISLPDRFEKQLKVLKSLPGSGATACQASISGEYRSPGMERYLEWSNHLISSEQIKVNRFSGSPIIHPTLMAHKALFTAYGAYSLGDQPEDYELWLRWLHHGVEIHKVPETLYQWRDHSGRLTRTDPRYQKLKFQQLKARYFDLWLNQTYDQAQLPLIYACGTGSNAKTISKALLAVGVRIEAYFDLDYRNRTEFMGKPVYTYRNMPEYTNIILNMVGDLKGKTKVRNFCINQGFTEGVNYFTFI